LVTRTVKVIITDLEHGLKSVVTAIFYCINNPQLVSFFVHRRNSRDRFRIMDIYLQTDLMVVSLYSGIYPVADVDVSCCSCM